jgi:hypothetical protein
MSVTPSTPSDERRATASATLKLTREGSTLRVLRYNPGAQDLLRPGPFEIQLDGRTVGSIKRHETVETPLEPGHHTLRIRSGRYSSQERSFDVTDGSVVNFRTHGGAGWLTYLASILKPDLAISLKHE